MKRRAFRTATAAGLAAGRLAEAQAPAAGVTGRSERLPRVGYLGSGHPSDRLSPRFMYLFEAFAHGMREGGYVDDQNVTVVWQFADQRYERLSPLAAELVRLGVSAIFAPTDHSATAAKQATDTIPIVFNGGVDPVASGFAVSLSRPGRNMTGFTQAGPAANGKRLGLLREAIPNVSRVALLRKPTGTIHVRHLPAAQEAAQALGLQARVFDSRGPHDFERAFLAIANDRAQAVLLISDTTFYIGREQLAKLALRHRLPMMGTLAEYARVGALMGHGSVISDEWRRAGLLIGKILNGARPADIPIEEPSTFELAVNLKAAKALGLTIPPSLLVQASQVIE